MKGKGYSEIIKNALERTVSYKDAAEIAKVDRATVRKYAKTFGYPDYIQLREMWNYFNKEIKKIREEEKYGKREREYRELILFGFEKMLNSRCREPFYCSIDGFRTYKLERAVRHVLKKHPKIWKEIERDLFSMLQSLGKCIMVEYNRRKYTLDDFLFEAIERSPDPNSIFFDEDFVIALFESLKNDKISQRSQ